MQVLKFGGSSVADATAMSRVLDIVSAAAARDRVVLVSSASVERLTCLSRQRKVQKRKNLSFWKNLRKNISKLSTGSSPEENC